MTRAMLVVGLLVLLASLARAQGFTQEQREESLEIALDFAQCAAFNYAMSDVGAETGRNPDEVRMNREYGNGSALAAEFLMSGSLLGPEMFAEDVEPAEAAAKFAEAKEFIEDQIDSNRAHWRVKLRSGDFDLGAKQMLRCNELLPMQVRIIENMRKQRFTTPPIYGSRKAD